MPSPPDAGRRTVPALRHHPGAGLGAGSPADRPAARRARLVSLGGEFSLWNPLLVDWMLWMRGNLPTWRCASSWTARSTCWGGFQDGSLDIAVLYSPPPRAELVLELVEEKLILVTTGEDDVIRPEDYLFVDWETPSPPTTPPRFPNWPMPASPSRLVLWL